MNIPLLNPFRASRCFRKGKELAEAGQWKEADANFQKSLELDPGRVDVWSVLAENILEHGGPKEITKAIQLCPSSREPDLGILIGKKKQLEGDLFGATEALADAHEKNAGSKKGLDLLYTLLVENRGNDELIGKVLGRVNSIPESALKNYYLGLMFIQVDDFNRAKSCVIKAEEGGYEKFDCNQALGVIHIKLGDYEGAYEFMARNLNLKPESSDAQFNAAMACSPYDSIRSAGHLRRTLELNPNHYLACMKLGGSLFDNNELDKAFELFERADKAKGDVASVESTYMLGLISETSDDAEVAEDYYRLALERNPSHIESLLRLVRLVEERGDNKDLADIYARFEQCNPTIDRAEYWFHKGRFLDAQKDLDESIDCLRQTIFLKPDWGEAWNNLSVQLRERGELEESRQCIDTALSLEPENKAFLVNKAVVLSEMGDIEESDAIFEALNVKFESDEEFVWLKCVSDLRIGRWREGWAGYKHRWSKVQADLKPPYSLEAYSGGKEQESGILVCKEQGLGDEIMFSSCFRDLSADVNKIVIECNPKIEQLFARSFPFATIKATPQGPSRSTDWLANYSDVKKQILAGDLPAIYRSEASDFPGHYPYLIADDNKKEYWKTVLGELSNLPKIGISWRGGTYKTRKQIRSFPLETLGPLLGLKDFTFISLQYGDVNEEIEKVNARMGRKVIHFQEAIDDYDETAALCKNLDLVISVQTSLVHLCGALGVPVWCLLPKVPEWRYASSGTEMIWYPSVSLYRQRGGNDWEGLIKAISSEVENKTFER